MQISRLVFLSFFYVLFFLFPGVRPKLSLCPRCVSMHFYFFCINLYILHIALLSINLYISSLSPQLIVTLLFIRHSVTGVLKTSIHSEFDNTERNNGVTVHSVNMIFLVNLKKYPVVTMIGHSEQVLYCSLI